MKFSIKKTNSADIVKSIISKSQKTLRIIKYPSIKGINATEGIIKVKIS